MKNKILLVPVQQYKHHVRSIALSSAVGLKVSARCSDAIRCISCELQLCCCIADVRGGSFNIWHHVPRGSRSSCQAARTTAKLHVIWSWTMKTSLPMSEGHPINIGFTLRVSHDNITTTRNMYIPSTYTKCSSFSVWWDIPVSAFHHCRAFCFRLRRIDYSTTK